MPLSLDGGDLHLKTFYKWVDYLNTSNISESSNVVIISGLDNGLPGLYMLLSWLYTTLAFWKEIFSLTYTFSNWFIAIFGTFSYYSFIVAISLYFFCVASLSAKNQRWYIPILTHTIETTTNFLLLTTRWRCGFFYVILPFAYWEWEILCWTFYKSL